jgi:lactate dehydrogenase-like 2-hydroxyacid dehydrogenase
MTAAGKPLLLVMVFLSEEHQQLVAQHYDTIYAPAQGQREDRSAAARAIAERGGEVRVVLTNGAHGILPQEIDALPKLELISSVGVGYEHIAVAHARSRGIRVSNAAGTNEECVADHAMMLLLAAARRLPYLNAGVRRGLWRDQIGRPPQVSFKRLGVLGLGAIGRAVAHRGEAFHMEIGYHTRTRRADSPYRYFESVLALAQWSDYLMVAAPGGEKTHHIIDAAVMEALGPQGVLVNISRGSLVDTSALAGALRAGKLLAAGLDVYEGEPVPPAALLDLENAIFTPHIAGLSPEAIHASVLRFLENAEAHFAGRPLVTPIR